MYNKTKIGLLEKYQKILDLKVKRHAVAEKFTLIHITQELEGLEYDA